METMARHQTAMAIRRSGRSLLIAIRRMAMYTWSCPTKFIGMKLKRVRYQDGTCKRYKKKARLPWDIEDLEIPITPNTAAGEWRVHTGITICELDPVSQHCWFDISTSLALDEAAGFLYIGGSKELNEATLPCSNNDITKPWTWAGSVDHIPTDSDPDGGMATGYGWMVRKLNISNGATAAEYKTDPSSNPLVSDGVLAIALSGNYLYVFGVGEQDLFYDAGAGGWSGKSRFYIAKLRKTDLSDAIANGGFPATQISDPTAKIPNDIFVEGAQDRL